MTAPALTAEQHDQVMNYRLVQSAKIVLRNLIVLSILGVLQFLVRTQMPETRAKITVKDLLADPTGSISGELLMPLLLVALMGAAIFTILQMIVAPVRMLMISNETVLKQIEGKGKTQSPISTHNPTAGPFAASKTPKLGPFTRTAQPKSGPFS